jgi:hemolysin III
MKSPNIQRQASRAFTAEEERVNTITHAFGVLFGIIAIPFLIDTAARHSAVSDVLRVSIYGISFLATYTLSTIYHGMQGEKIKERFEKFDRISIYFFIAGTYTPFVLYYMHDQTGVVLLTTVWVFVGLGIFYELFLINRYMILSLFFYMAMGLMFAFVSKQFFAMMPRTVMILVLTGVLLYCIGVIFFVWQKWKYHHAIWHALVLAASICHYLAVLETVS